MRKATELTGDMNALYEPWISVLTCDGENKDVGLLEFFRNAKSYVWFSFSKATDIICLMRFAHYVIRASGYEKDGDEDNLDDMINHVVNYLKEKEDCFYLGGEKAFLQINSKNVVFSDNGWKDLHSSDIFINAGPNGNVFGDRHYVDPSVVECNPFLILLNILMFGQGGLQAVLESWSNKFINVNNAATNFFNFIGGTVYYFVAENMLDTLYLNLPIVEDGEFTPLWDIDFDATSVPWECHRTKVKGDKGESKTSDSYYFVNKEIKKYVESYMGSLIPLRLMVQVKPESNKIYCIKGATRKIHIPDSTITYRFDEKNNEYVPTYHNALMVSSEALVGLAVDDSKKEALNNNYNSEVISDYILEGGKLVFWAGQYKSRKFCTIPVSNVCNMVACTRTLSQGNKIAVVFNDYYNNAKKYVSNAIYKCKMQSAKKNANGKLKFKSCWDFNVYNEIDKQMSVTYQNIIRMIFSDQYSEQQVEDFYKRMIPRKLKEFYFGISVSQNDGFATHVQAINEPYIRVKGEYKNAQ